MVEKKWNEKTWVIVTLLIFFSPLGLYYTWKNPNWNLNSKTIIFLFFFFPLGLYLMFKHNIWSVKTRIVITFSFCFLIFLGIYLPPPFNPNTVYRVENVMECNECYSLWYVKVLDENSGYFMSVGDESQGCKLEFSYKKDKENLTINLLDSRHVSGTCFNQFGGNFIRKNGKWTNGNILIGQTSSVKLY